ncbi:MAG: ion transporter [Methanotrichaceae archaeon]|nr:ion transporter [Methanotrichaceae archaeon]
MAESQGKVLMGGRKVSELTFYDTLIMFLAILSIILLFYVMLFGNRMPPAVYEYLSLINRWIAFIFLFDFFRSLHLASSKSGYFFRQYGFLDLLGGIPIEQFAVFRLARIVRVYRILRVMSLGELIHQFKRQLAQNTFAATILAVIVVVSFAGAWVLRAESELETANIKTPADAIWWCLVTITTVGYGDFYPVTSSGRMVGVFVMFSGVALIGVLSGLLANQFVKITKGLESEENGAEKKPEKEVTLDMLQAQLEELKADSQVSKSDSEALKIHIEKMNKILEQMQSSMQDPKSPSTKDRPP